MVFSYGSLNNPNRFPSVKSVTCIQSLQVFSFHVPPENECTLSPKNQEEYCRRPVSGPPHAHIRDWNKILMHTSDIRYNQSLNTTHPGATCWAPEFCPLAHVVGAQTHLYLWSSHHYIFHCIPRQVVRTLLKPSPDPIAPCCMFQGYDWVHVTVGLVACL
jgi:hypothetical protein